MYEECYNEYLQSLNQYATVDNNPDIIEKVVNELKYILFLCDEIKYDMGHFEYLYENLYNKIKIAAYSGDNDSISDISFSFFSDEYQAKLMELSNSLDKIANIHENTSNDKIKEWSLKIYKWVYNEDCTELSIENIENYINKYENFNDALVLIDNFVEEPQSYTVEYYEAYFLNFIDKMLHEAMMFNIDGVKELISKIKDHDIVNILYELSITLDKLIKIRQSSDDFCINEKIDDLLENVRKERIVNNYNVEKYNNCAKEIIKEYRYG
jgi:hypothetical protein